jgi:hypothetical protein
MDNQGQKMDTGMRNTQHGSVYAMGIWLAAVDYNTVKVEATSMELKIRVTNGERDLSPSSIFAEEMELEMADGRRGKMLPLSGSVASGVYSVWLDIAHASSPTLYTAP